MNETKVKVLITGASGYVGAMIYKYLQNARIEVVGTYFSTKLFDELIYCNLTNESEVSQLFDKHNPTVVVHIAANASNGSCEDDPEGANKLNVDATKYLVEEAKKHESKFIFISSFAAYNPKGIYGQTKVTGEELVSTVNEYVILRPSLIVGLSPNTKNDRPFNRFVRDIEEHKKEVEYDASWEFNVTFLSHLAEVCLNIITENKYKNIMIPITSKGIISRYKLAKDILENFNIEVKSIDKNAKSIEPEIDWSIYSTLDLPTKEYEDGIREIISDLKRLSNKN